MAQVEAVPQSLLVDGLWPDGYPIGRVYRDDGGRQVWQYSTGEPEGEGERSVYLGCIDRVWGDGGWAYASDEKRGGLSFLIPGVANLNEAFDRFDYCADLAALEWLETLAIKAIRKRVERSFSWQRLNAQ